MRRLMALCLGVMACSSSSQPSSTASANEAANLDQTALTASSAVTQYQQAAAAATNQTQCMAALQQYMGQMQPLLGQMRSMAGPMDDYMKSAGNMMSGDMECGVQVMADELAHHQAVACTSSDMAANHAEAQRDVDAMMSFTGHMEMRSVQAGGMMGQGSVMGSPGRMMDAGWMSGWSDGGWMMPDGGMVNYDQPMPGCTYTSGGVQASDGGYWMDGGWTMGPGMMDGGSGPGTMMDGGTGPMMDGGTAGGGTGTMMDGGTAGGGMMDAGTAGGGMTDAGMFNGPLAGGAQRCAPSSTCTGPMMMAPNYICSDGSVAGPACVTLGDGTCGWRMLACP